MLRDQELAGLAMTLGRDAKIRITVNGDDSYCTPDGSHINIARMPSTPVGRMLMTGLVFHEVVHKNYTQGGRPDGLLGDMMNVIEDIRVDRETVKARPGTCFNLEAVTTHFVKKGSLTPQELPQALLGKVLAYGFGRLLNHKAILPMEALCDEMMNDAFGPDFVADVEHIIKNIPRLKSTKETTAMAQQLIDLLIQQQCAPQQPSKPSASGPQQEPQSGTGKNAGEGLRSGNADGTVPGKKGQSDSGNGKPQNDAGTAPPQPQTDTPHDENKPNSQTAAGSGGNGAGTGGGKRPTPEEIQEMLKNKTGYGDLSALIQSELNDLAGNIPFDDRTGIHMLPVIGKLKAQHGKLNEVEALSASSRMRAKLMGLLQAVKRHPESYGLSGR